jgi:hypothetical protein
LVADTAIIRRAYPCHTPRRRGIQYAAALRFNRDASEYWIIRLRG